MAERLSPVCTLRGYEVGKWHFFEYSERHAPFYPPCELEGCFENGPPEPGETVARARRNPGVIHEVTAIAENTEPEPEPERPGDTTPNRPNPATEPVESIADLKPGDRVLYADKTFPLEVVSRSPRSAVLEGHEGGRYVLEDNSYIRPEPFRLIDGPYVESLEKTTEAEASD